jgi:hypothetical protein
LNEGAAIDFVRDAFAISRRSPSTTAARPCCRRPA